MFRRVIWENMLVTPVPHRLGHPAHTVLGEPSLRHRDVTLHGGHVGIAVGDVHPEGAFVDVDLIVHIQAVGQRHLVEQEILSSQVPRFGESVVGGVVSVHVLVQALHHVREAVHVDYVGPRFVPLRERVRRREELGIGHPLRLTGVQGVGHAIEGRSGSPSRSRWPGVWRDGDRSTL